jgi:uncharacterized protein YfdQ (DUF2303 family)
VRQREALALYERFGFRCAPYNGGPADLIEVRTEKAL